MGGEGSSEGSASLSGPQGAARGCGRDPQRAFWEPRGAPVPARYPVDGVTVRRTPIYPVTFTRRQVMGRFVRALRIRGPHTINTMTRVTRNSRRPTISYGTGTRALSSSNQCSPARPFPFQSRLGAR